MRTICLIVLTFALCGFATPSAEEGAPPSAQRGSGDPVARFPRRSGHRRREGSCAACSSRRPGSRFFTWDPLLHRRPDRPGRRWGTDFLVRKVLGVVAGYAEAHPSAPRLGIGDLSRRRGGPFGPRHASHQNGLDVDVYYPRRDRRERPPLVASQIEHRLAQDLVDRFVTAGASLVFVGPNTRLTGPPGVVQVLWNHDNHLHARFEDPDRT